MAYLENLSYQNDHKIITYTVGKLLNYPRCTYLVIYANDFTSQGNSLKWSMIEDILPETDVITISKNT